MNGGSSSGGLLQALSLRKKFEECESERTPLLNLEDKAALEPVSEPLTPASNPSPFVSTPISASASNTGSLQAPESRPLSDESSDITSVLEDFLNVALVTAFFFFFFLEFLLVDDMRNEAFLVAFPCAFFLGLLSSIFAVIIAIDYMWRYAALEFAVVAMVIFLFHSLLHLKPLWEIAVSSILGFSMSMSLNKLYTRYFG
ncbi:uncharacterized protein LOC127811044 isoform X2 [Diospyros lotus]|nr:uncharacterized protein LOC127811044 isoform X2 [Diospyros lotus]